MTLRGHEVVIEPLWPVQALLKEDELRKNRTTVITGHPIYVELTLVTVSRTNPYDMDYSVWGAGTIEHCRIPLPP